MEIGWIVLSLVLMVRHCWPALIKLLNNGHWRVKKYSLSLIKVGSIWLSFDPYKRPKIIKSPWSHLRAIEQFTYGHYKVRNNAHYPMTIGWIVFALVQMVPKSWQVVPNKSRCGMWKAMGSSHFLKTVIWSMRFLVQMAKPWCLLVATIRFRFGDKGRMCLTLHSIEGGWASSSSMRMAAGLLP